MGLVLNSKTLGTHAGRPKSYFRQGSPNFRATKEPVGTMGSVRTASKPCRVQMCIRRSSCNNNIDSLSEADYLRVPLLLTQWYRTSI